MKHSSSAQWPLLLALVTLGCGGPGGNPADREAANRDYNEAVAALQSQDFQTAVDKFSRALETGYLNADRYVDASVQRAIGLAGLGDFDAAHAALDELEKDAQVIEVSYAARGFIFEKQGRKKQAAAAWKKARRSNRRGGNR